MRPLVLAWKDCARDIDANDLENLDCVALVTPDLNGALRGKAMRASEFADRARDETTTITDLVLATDSSDGPVFTFVGIVPSTGFRDLRLVPDLATLIELPWRPRWAWCLADLAWADGSPCELSPRKCCRRALTGLDMLGHSARVAFEYEFRLYDRASGAPVTGGLSYGLHQLAEITGFMDDLRSAAAACAIELSALHTESAPGLAEVNLQPTFGLAADKAIWLKGCIEEIAALHGMRASFAAKPVAGEEGSGGHLHISLIDQDGVNLFSAAVDRPAEVSRVLGSAIEGVLRHTAALSLVYNPNINSYKRLLPGYFAPTTADWSIGSRAAAVCVARPAPDNSHLEVRRPGADAKPHLVLAAVAVSIAAGVEAGEEPAEAGTPLPGDLGGAVRAFADDAVIRHRLGDAFCDHHAATRRWELAAWRSVFTDWEIDRIEAVHSRPGGRVQR